MDKIDVKGEAKGYTPLAKGGFLNLNTFSLHSNKICNANWIFITLWQMLEWHTSTLLCWKLQNSFSFHISQHFRSRKYYIILVCGLLTYTLQKSLQRPLISLNKLPQHCRKGQGIVWEDLLTRFLNRLFQQYIMIFINVKLLEFPV